MQPPVTQEELDKRDSLSSEIALTDDVMRMLEGVEDPIIRLKILKSLLSNVISNQEVIELIQDQINQLEKEIEEEEEDNDFDGGSGEDLLGDLDLGGSLGGDFGDDLGGDFGTEEGGDDLFSDLEVEEGGEEGETLPTPAELGNGLDFTDEM